ncbi:MAG TPA: hypothetical protein VL463_01385 [Kofleriaceae bacterium]|nr:hypothetical protein [Kofleriaceae bacterium]
MRLATALLLLGACGDNIRPAEPDAGAPAAPDAAGPSFQMGPHPISAQVVSEGGPVLASPKVAAIFFGADDTLMPDVELFLAKLPGSSYWHAIANEYGVGDIAIDPTVVSTDAAPTSDADIQSYVATMSDGTHAGWPANDGTTIYTVFLPPGVTLSDFPGACTSWGGYHSEGMDAKGMPFVYAVLPRCSTQGNFLYPATLATSHELLEAATDPYPYSNPAFDQNDADHIAWGSIGGAELGDMCEFVRAANEAKLDIYSVQRQWSNAASAAGLDPCVPTDKAFQGAGAVLNDTLTLTHQGQTFTTKGIAIPVGTSKTIDVQLWTDRATPSFEVNAYDAASQYRGGTAELTFAWDKRSGVNGDTLHLTITHVKAGRRGSSTFVIFAGPAADTQSQWWGLVGN